MSNYRDLISDFPSRCAELLMSYENHAQLIDREVTLLLAMATAGLTIPFERLRPPAEGDEYPHPSGDRNKYPEARTKLDSLLKPQQCFLGSVLWGVAPASWLAGEVKDVTDDPDLWLDLAIKPKPIGNKKTVKTVLTILRNALAHGNIYTRGQPSQIEQIVFVSRISDTSRHRFVAASPNDFRKFLCNWFDFWGTLNMPTKVALAVVEYTL